MEDKIYCPTCGAPNNRENSFCGSCGVQMDSKTQGFPAATPVAPSQPIPQPTPSTTPYQPQQQPVYVVQQQVATQSEPVFLTLGIIGLVIGTLSLLFFSWHVWFSYGLWVPFVYLGISIIGIILSAISIKKGNKGISITGLVLSILGGLTQITAVFLIMFVFYLFY